MFAPKWEQKILGSVSALLAMAASYFQAGSRIKDSGQPFDINN